MGFQFAQRYSSDRKEMRERPFTATRSLFRNIADNRDGTAPHSWYEHEQLFSRKTSGDALTFGHQIHCDVPDVQVVMRAACMICFHRLPRVVYDKRSDWLLYAAQPHVVPMPPVHSSRHHVITPSRNHAITPSRNHAITPSRHHVITPTRHHAIT